MGAVMAEMFGKANGCSRGRGGSMHLFDTSRRFYGGYAIVSGGLLIGWLPFAFTIAMNGLEVGIAFIQAYIFTGLTCVYLGDAFHLHGSEDHAH